MKNRCGEYQIVVPASNAARSLEQTLPSVLAQTRSKWEGAPVDERSMDSAAETARAFASQVYQAPGFAIAMAANAIRPAPEVRCNA